MTYIRHGFSIGIERAGEHIFLSLKAVGKLTHGDYQVMTPMIDKALGEVKDPQVNVLIDVTDFEGWELRAAWDDFKLGLKHGNEFDKIALYGNRKWQEKMATIAGWFMSGQTRYFEDEAQALEWLEE